MGIYYMGCLTSCCMDERLRRRYTDRIRALKRERFPGDAMCDRFRKCPACHTIMELGWGTWRQDALTQYQRQMEAEAKGMGGVLGIRSRTKAQFDEDVRLAEEKYPDIYDYYAVTGQRMTCPGCRRAFTVTQCNKVTQADFQ